MDENDRTGGNAFRLFALCGFVAPMITFIVAVSGLSAEFKIILLAAVAVAYCTLAFWANSRQRTNETQSDVRSDIDGDPVAEKLAALDEASRFFGASLNRADMFRLVTARVGEIFSVSASALFVADPARKVMKPSAADGKMAGLLEDREFELESCLAGMAWLSGEIETDRDLKMERAAFGADLPETFRSAVALPLMHEGAAFAVFEIFTFDQIADQDAVLDTLEAIRSRITPLLLGSFAVDRSLSNALTDSVTQLPNERAFYMVLENQLAESIRFHEDRPLSVLAIDIRNFDEANRQFGHAVGDQILKFVSEIIKQELRKMDFLARSINDEFLLVLPTASEQTAEVVIGRLQARFAEDTFSVNDEDRVAIRLNYGSATYWKDGETPQQLVRHELVEWRDTVKQNAACVCSVLPDVGHRSPGPVRAPI